MFRSFILFLFSFFVFFCLAFSQDSPPANPVLTFSVSERTFDQGSYSPLDTSLDNYHYYLPGFFHNYKTLGNTGSPGQSMIYANPTGTGFKTGPDFMDVYGSKKEELRYFDTKRPFSKVFFLIGPKEEQVLKVKHTQNIGRPFNFGLEYTNVGSTGFYQRQKSLLNDVHFHSRFEAKNKIYGNFASFIYDKMSVEESGGLDDDDSFELFTDERKDGMTMKLTNASNLYKKKSFYVKQYMNFGKLSEIYDAEDSVTRKVVSPVLRLAHTFSFEKKVFMYKDLAPDSFQYLPLFNYNNMIGPAGSIKDSVNVKVYENAVSLSTVDFTGLTGKHEGFKNFFSSVFVKHQNVQRLTHNDNFDSTFQNLMAGGEANVRFLKIMSTGGSAIQVLDGFNKDDNFFNGYLEAAPSFNKKDTISDETPGPVHHFRLESFHQVKHPDWIYTHYYSDQLRWQNSFSNSSYSGQSFSYHNEKWKISFGVSQNYVKNPVYFAETDIFGPDTIFIARRIIPQQHGSRIKIDQAWLSKTFKVWKFHLRSNVYYQETSNPVVLPLPVIITHNSFYFESLMLRKSIYGQLGVDFYYHTGYYANAYSPFLKSFYLQDKKIIGDYPYFDFFLNFKIKSVRAFFKITHFNSGFSGNTYYLIPHYPQADRAFRFGIDWRFLD